MKLLLVFVSALVLVASSNAAPSNDQDRVIQVQEEVVADADAGQQAAEVEVEDTFAEAVPAIDEPRVVGAGPQRSFALDDFAGELNVYTPQSIYVPIISKACTNSACLYICNLLGFANGTCVSTTTCQCYN